MTNQSPPKCRARDKCSDFPVHSPCRGLVWLETLLTGGICPDALSSQSSPFPSRLIISSSTHCEAALKDVLTHLPSHAGLQYCFAFTCCCQMPECNGPFALPCRKQDSFHCWNKGRLSSRSGHEPIADGGRDEAQADTGDAKKLNVSQAWQDQPVVVLVYTSHSMSEDAGGLGELGPSTSSSVWQMPMCVSTDK